MALHRLILAGKQEVFNGTERAEAHRDGAHVALQRRVLADKRKLLEQLCQVQVIHNLDVLCPSQHLQSRLKLLEQLCQTPAHRARCECALPITAPAPAQRRGCAQLVAGHVSGASGRSGRKHRKDRGSTVRGRQVAVVGAHIGKQLRACGHPDHHRFSRREE